MAETVTISFTTGAALMCRKPVAQAIISCNHKGWLLDRLGFGYCSADLPFTGTREMYCTEGCCDRVKAAIAALPSYREQELRDQRLYPEAQPCSCSQ